MANEIQPGSRVVRVPAPRGPANMAPAAGAMTPREIVGILRRHVFMIVALSILGTCVGGGLWFLLKRFAPKFTSMGTIQVLPDIQIAPGTFSTITPNKDMQFEFRSTKAFRFQHQGFLEELLMDDQIIEMDWYKNRNTTLKRVEYLQKNLNASAARDMGHIVVSMKSKNAEEARDTAQEAIDLFLSLAKADAIGDTVANLKTYNTQRDSTQRDINSLEDSLERMRLGTNIGDLNKANFRGYLDDKLQNLENAKNVLNRSIESMKERVNFLLIRKDTEDFDEVVRERVEQDPVATNMRLKVDTLEVELKRLKSQFGNNHKRVKETANALQEQKKVLNNWKIQIGELIRKSQWILAMEEQEILKAQLDSQRIEVDNARDEYRDLHRLRAEYEKEVVKRDEVQAKLEEFNNHIKDLIIIQNTSTLSKVKPGMIPRKPLKMSSPDWRIYIPGGLVLGFMLGVGLAFAIEMLNDLLRSPSEVIKHMRAPLLGTICHKSEDRTVKGLNLYHVVREAPYSIMSEAYRQFRTSLTLSGSGTDHKTLLITSGNPGEGKTSVAVSTAYTFVADGKRVLLIDTNFRKPSTTVLFKRTKTDGSELKHPDFGLSNYLMDQCDKDSIIRFSNYDGLDIIDSGPLPLNPSELLGSSKMIELINIVRQEYDYVIIDGPPMLVSEAKTLASEVDGTILVFNAEQTRRGAAERALRELKEVNANVLGSVLIGVKSMKGGYFHEKYNTYQRYQKVKPSLKA